MTLARIQDTRPRPSTQQSRSKSGPIFLKPRPNPAVKAKVKDSKVKAKGTLFQPTDKAKDRTVKANVKGPTVKAMHTKKLKTRTRIRTCPRGTNNLIQMNVKISKFKFMVIFNTSHTMHNLAAVAQW